MMVRHAEAHGNREGRMLGHQETALTAHGISQAQSLKRQLQQQAVLPNCLYTSPQRRACQTARILAGSSGVPIHVCEDLRELDQGLFTGLTWAEAYHRYPELCARLEGTSDWLPVPGAESPQAARVRAERFLSALLSSSPDPAAPCPTILVVTHGGLLPHLLCALLGSARTWGMNAAATARFEFVLDWQRWLQPEAVHRLNSTLWRIERFNDTSHLSQMP